MGYTDIKELLKDARDIASGANDLQLKGILLDIQGMVYDLQDENRDLREENHELKNQKITEDDLIKVGNFWKKPDKEYLYCPKCWGKDDKLVVCNITMQGEQNRVGAVINEKQYGICPVCRYMRLLTE
ncbi:hypothetical protein [Latilactobacillus curvatus]|uniref:hypothetical protein n=1 Tax=Latilactobacillus curvatus TaxID=28038 RepID=UPI00240F0F83|nr:hypothetical protein [Latilactobacillus curvatus]MDG2980899.1 hypothetical protein [Latilactobacillus curvatus]WEU69523.1 hypothetical protein [Latilactobacillus phage TMW 1.1365 P2]